MPVILVALAKVADVVIPLMAIVAAINGWRAWRSVPRDRSRMSKALWWIAGPWLVVVLLTGFAGVEELLEDGFDGNPVILSPIVGIALMLAIMVDRIRSPAPQGPA
jgi:hypothetical protein